MQVKYKEYCSFLLMSLLILVSGCKTHTKSEETATETESSLKKGVILVDYREQRKVDVYMDGDVFTSYIYPENMEKPVLFPLRTSEGTVVTRGFPIKPREGERTDHPHHAGIWFNYGDVNGFDFWGNSYAVSAEKKLHCGRILHRGVKRAESRDDVGVLEIAADWQVPAENNSWHTLLQEQTILKFSGDENTRTIDRITRLTAQEDEVVFSDTKEGMYAIRLAREFEYPSDQPLILTDANGVPEKDKKINNDGVNGHYINSEGVEGLDVWGKRARWVCLSSNIGEEKISVALFDHPDNYGHPSYWHARGYGLFSVNNLGAQGFDKNADPSEVRLMPGESMVFRHRLYLTSGTQHANVDQLEDCYNSFIKIR